MISVQQFLNTAAPKDKTVSDKASAIAKKSAIKMRASEKASKVMRRQPQLQRQPVSVAAANPGKFWMDQSSGAQQEWNDFSQYMDINTFLHC